MSAMSRDGQCQMLAYTADLTSCYSQKGLCERGTAPIRFEIAAIHLYAALR